MDIKPKLYSEVAWDTTARRNRYSERERRGYLLCGAWVGTMLAGGTFGAILFFRQVVAENVSLSSYDSMTSILVGLGQVILGSIAGFVIGLIWAGYLSVAVTALALAILLGIGVHRTPLWVASCVGAWTAFFCCGGFHWIPILLGQVGAQYFGHRQIAGNPQRNYAEYDGPPRRQYGLTQLFRFTTVICVASAVVTLLPLSDEFRIQMGYCLTWQCVSILLVLGARSVWERCST